MNHSVMAYGSWSDCFEHIAIELTQLYEWRAASNNKTVETWLHDLAKARGPHSFHELITRRLRSSNATSSEYLGK